MIATSQACAALVIVLIASFCSPSASITVYVAVDGTLSQVHEVSLLPVIVTQKSREVVSHEIVPRPFPAFCLHKIPGKVSDHL